MLRYCRGATSSKTARQKTKTYGVSAEVKMERQAEGLKNPEVDITLEPNAMFGLIQCLKHLQNIYEVKITHHMKVNRTPNAGF